MGYYNNILDRKKFQMYYIEDMYGKGLYNVRGNIYWKYVENLEDLLDVTKFNTAQEAENFCEKVGISYYTYNVRKVTIKVN